MTPIPPDRSDEVRRSITTAYRLKRRAQLEAMRADVRDLTASIKALGFRLSLLAGQVNVMLLEMDTDATTQRLPILRDKRERPFLD